MTAGEELDTWVMRRAPSPAEERRLSDIALLLERCAAIRVSSGGWAR